MDETKDFSEPADKSPADDENKSAISSDLIRGHINTIILRTLYERDKYGYEIIEEIEKKSHGQYSLKQPTLYSALKRLESQGYINAYWKTEEVSLGGRRKYYTLTDSGREIAERNQAEWEYSRTVIDNLISDRSFDFSQPAPASVDFKILKKSTSRVPLVRDDDDEEDEDEFEEVIESAEEPRHAEVEETKQPTETKNVLPEVEIKPETITFAEPLKTVYYETAIAAPSPTPEPAVEQPAPATEPVAQTVVQPAPEPPEPEPLIQIQPVPDPSVSEPSAQTIQQPVYSQPVAEERIVRDPPTMSEEQRRIVHENYIKLISKPIPEPKNDEPDVMPVADEIDTEKLIYNNKPETERDYRNLINSLFVRTIKHNPQEQEIVEEQPAPPASTVRIEDINAKADKDGLKINSSDYVVSARKKHYNRGATLFKSSLIVGVVLLLEFMFSLFFKNKLGVNGVSLAYPFVIFAIDVAQLLIFGIVHYTGLVKNSRKPNSNLYLSTCIIVTVVLILIIFIVSILLNVNFSVAGDLFAKIIIPCLVALNIPLFAGCFYAFSKYSE